MTNVRSRVGNPLSGEPLSGERRWAGSLPDQASGGKEPLCPWISWPVLSSLAIGESWFGLFQMAGVYRRLAWIHRMNELMSAGFISQRWSLAVMGVSFGNTKVRWQVVLEAACPLGGNFWTFAPSGRKSWGSLGWAKGISQEEGGERFDCSKAISGKHGDVMSPLSSQCILHPNIWEGLRIEALYFAC